MTPKSGKVIAWLSFVLGILVSIAGNIGHAASDGMKPGEWAGAAFWPLALMLTIEILTRVRWQPGKRWTIARFAALLLVALVAAVLSYRHLAGLMTYWGEDWANAHLGPLAVDGLMLIAATALLSISKERDVVPWDDPKADLAADLQAMKKRYASDFGVPLDDVIARPLEPKDAEIIDLIDKATKPKVQTSKTVPASAAEEAAFQAWYNAPAGQKPSVRKLADLAGISPSKAHRLISNWKQLEAVR